MTRTTWVVVALAIVTGLALIPGAAAYAADEDPGKCEKIAGRSVCVAYNEGGCDVWVSAGWGGCFVVPSSD